MTDNEDQKIFFHYTGEDIYDVVYALQKIHRGRAVVSRTPEGIVAHPSPVVEYERLSDVQDNERPSSKQSTLSIRVPDSGRARK